MKVLELGERLRYEVQSTTKAGENRLVDMGENEGAGQCSCWKFAKHIKTALEQDIARWRASGKSEPFTYLSSEMFECEHIRAVRRYLSNRLIQTIREAHPDDNQQT